VILANPPFMSPKGGIKPHKRFSIQAKRSEVLFVDYMAEHLTPTGRAGIIVPEGIIFQSQSAYTALRKMLVENSLVAVISLPAGVFQPYSGVKTSILILDKSLARQSNTIAFFKVENDGFGLGAQRRTIEKNDLPQVQAEVAAYLAAVRSGASTESILAAASTAQIVAKEKIAANGDYNLSGERYRESVARTSHFPIVALGEVCELIGGSTPSKQNEAYWTNGTVKWISSKHIDEQGSINGYELISQAAVDESSTRIAPKKSTIIITRVSVGKFAFADDDYAVNQDLTAVVTKDAEQLAPEFIRVIAHHIAAVVERNAEGIGVRGVTRKFLSELQIPLPPLEVQKEIVAEIEGYQKVINGARAVIDNYRPHIPIQPDWPMVELGEMCSAIQNGYPVEQSDKPGRIKVTRIQTIADGTVDLEKTKWTNDTVPADRLMQAGDILFSHINSIDHLAKTAIFVGTPVPVVHGINLIRFQPKRDVVVPSFLLWSMKQESFVEKAKTFAQRAVNQASIKVTDIRAMEIALPPLSTQQAIVAEIEAEQALVSANRELITRFEAKIQTTLARIWGEDAPAA
jgi:type I restriction enzyme M protein